MRTRLCTINGVQWTFKAQIDKYRQTYFNSPICFFKKIGDSYYYSDKTNHLVTFQPPKEIQADQLHEWDYTTKPVNHDVTFLYWRPQKIWVWVYYWPQSSSFVFNKISERDMKPLHCEIKENPEGELVW